MQEETHTCVYCGQPATHQFKNGKWCCSENRQQCPAMIQRHAEKATHNHQICLEKYGQMGFSKGCSLGLTPSIDHSIEHHSKYPFRGDHICVYCGSYAEYQLKDGRWCCQKNRNSCPEIRKKTSLGMKKSYDSGHRVSATKGRPAWSKGLTKETDDRVARVTRLLKEGYHSGRLISRWKGKHHTLETRIKLSRIKVQMYSNGTLSSKVKGVKFYREKNLNGVEYAIQGTWELAVARKLNDMKILWEKGASIKYTKEDGSVHQYLPDFYLPATNEYIEVKGFFTELDKAKMRLVLKQNSIALFFIGPDKYKQFINGEISLQECTNIPW